MNTIKSWKLVFTLAVVLLFGFTAQGQKIGYLNSALLLQDVPAFKQASANLEALQTQLQRKGQAMLEEFRNKYMELQRKEQQGELSPKQLEEESQRLQAEQGKLEQFEQDMQNQLTEKQRSLTQPILDELTEKINEVARDGGYQLIIDDAQNVLLFKDPSLDVSGEVRKKLGLD